MTIADQPDPVADVDVTQPLEDDSIAPDDTGENPYPGADNRTWTDRFSAALAAETGLPRDITDRVAPFVVTPKRYLVQGRGSAADSLRPGVVRPNNTGQKVLTVRAHGFAGNAGEYNERIRTSYPSPVTPGADPMKTLPGLTTGRTSTGELAPFITTTTPVEPTRLNTILGVMNHALDEADGNRGYDLAEDIEIYGQQETTLHVILVRKIAEPGGEDGMRVRTVVDLTAVKGANRSRARLHLFGLTPEAIVFGVRPMTVMGLHRADTPEPPVADPRVWVPRLAAALKAAWADASHPGHERARRAQQVATVQLELIIGGEPLEEFHNHVFDPNRVDHRRPPLDYQPRDKAASDFRALLRDYKAQGVYSEAERAWLAGEGPDPAPVPGESVVDARDRRDRALLDVVFPPRLPGAPVPLWPRARVVLGEPARSQAGRKQVDARTRMYSAASSDAYRARWNPRVLEALFPATAIRDQMTFHDTPSWAELTARFAAGDYNDLLTFITTRGMHWLAEYGLVDADRGSTEAQGEATDSGEERARFVRRTMINIRTALVDKPQRAVGLFKELAAAAESGTWPRAVDDEGLPVPESQATRVWFNEAFPKVRRLLPPIPPENPPEQPPPSPQQRLLHAQDHFANVTTGTLMTGIVAVFDAGRELVSAAAVAGQAALPDGGNPVAEAVERACAAAMADVSTVVSLLPQLKYGEVSASKFEEPKCAAFLEEAAD